MIEPIALSYAIFFALIFIVAIITILDYRKTKNLLKKVEKLNAKTKT